MQSSHWVRQRIETLARSHQAVWVEDPYRLLSEDDSRVVEQSLGGEGYRFAVVNNGFRLRRFLDDLKPNDSRPRFVVVDQSYTTLDPHLLPQDAKPSDLKPLTAPDWKPLVPAEARFRPTVRDFLVEATGFDDWPNEVNIFPYERLARSRPADFIDAYSAFRSMGRALTSNDLIMVGASAVLRFNLFELSDPVDALEIAFHAEDRWAELRQMFNLDERAVVRQRLQSLPAPIGELFGEHADLARTAVGALIVLRQHFGERTGAHLRYLSPDLARYSSCDVPVAREPAAWFLAEEVPRFERLAGPDFLTHVRDEMKLDDADQARKFGREEKLSATMRSLVAFEIERPRLELGLQRDRFSLSNLIPEFTKAKADLERIVGRTRSTIDGFRLRPSGRLKLEELMRQFDQAGIHLVDRLAGRLNGLAQEIMGPAKLQWPSVPGFEARWTKEHAACRDLIADAFKLRDELDHTFGRLLEDRYSELVPAEMLPADQFYEKFMAPRRRDSSGNLKRAVVLVIDSMRLDIWREIVRPALETEYDVEEQLGFALLPSETRYSRRAIFSGKTPGTGTEGKESDLLAQLMSRVHGRTVEFDDLEPRRAGMAFGVRSRDGHHNTYAAVFDFPDVLSHEVDWDPHTLHEVQRPLVDNIRALLAEAGPDALVFITADHGHVLQERGAPVRVRGAVNGVGYRAAQVSQRLEGEAAAKVFQIDARKLRHNTTGWFVFPKPGFALRDAADDGKRFKPSANYRHGGISMVEVVVPLACLRHRSAVTRVVLTPSIRGTARVGEPVLLELGIRADAALASAVTVTADVEGSSPVRVEEVGPVARPASMTWLPLSPGRQTITFAAYLAGEKVGEATLQVEVAKPKATQEDLARTKLAKLFGDD